LIREESEIIYQETNTKALARDQILSRVLQELRDEGCVEFLDNEGTCRLK